MASVHVSVESFNENAPVFLGAPYITSIVEASTVGATVLVVQVHTNTNLVVLLYAVSLK